MSRGRSVLARALLSLTALLLWAGHATAHTGGTTGFARVTIEGETVRYNLTLDIEAVSKAQSGPVEGGRDALADIVARHVEVSADGKACAALPGTVQPSQPGRSVVVIVVHYVCAGPVGTLTLRDGSSAVFGRDHHTLVHVEGAGGVEQALLDPDRSEMQVVVGGPSAGPSDAPAVPQGAYGFFQLGIEHIVTGFDHILFLFALMLRGGRIGSLLAIVTAFTVGHSLTLGLSVLDVVRLPGSIIEPLIAVSIAYVACENVFLRRAPSRRWLVSLAFGLVHGFGFAGALLELELPRASLFSSLLFFNLGVEAGQAAIVAVLFPALLLLSRFSWERRAVTAISAVVLVAALGLLAERIVVG